MANARAFFPLVSDAFEIKKNKREEYVRRANIKRRDFSEYTEGCCSSFEFDMFTFMSATVRLE